MTTRNLSIRLALEGGQQVKRELEEVGATGQRALQRVRDASQPASKGLLAVDTASREVQASLNRFAGQLGPVGRGLTALGPAGLAAGAAIGGVVLALRQGLDAAAEAEQRMFRLEGVLRATGHASGLTARELEQFAIGLDRSTLAAKNDVLEAAGVLATFRSISGETFKDTLRLAQDLAAVLGGDLRGQVALLGRALEDPVQGLTALRRVGVSFTQSQREAIAAMAEAGDVASAQRAILAELERQVGGAGAAEAQGLKGAVDGLSLAWRLLLEEIGKTPVVTGIAGERPPAVRYADPSAFEHAPRYHSGGFAGFGLLPDEVPIIARRGELVVPPERIVREEKCREHIKLTDLVAHGLTAGGWWWALAGLVGKPQGLSTDPRGRVAQRRQAARSRS